MASRTSTASNLQPITSNPSSSPTPMNTQTSQSAARLLVYVPARGRALYASDAEASSFTKSRAKAYRFTQGQAFAALGRTNSGKLSNCYTCFADC